MLLSFLFFFYSWLPALSPSQPKADLQHSEANSLLVELFTSEGCSSCPPADKLLSNMRTEYQAEKVLFLSYHVDYWDHLGWKDAYSQKAFSELQYKINSDMKSGNNYTPQAFIQRSKEVLGSRKSQVVAGIDKYKGKMKAQNQNAFTVAHAANNQLTVTPQVGTASKSSYLILFRKDVERQIQKGENGGKKLHHSQVVIWQKRATLNNEQTITLPETGTTWSDYGLALLDLDGKGAIQSVSSLSDLK